MYFLFFLGLFATPLKYFDIIKKPDKTKTGNFQDVGVPQIYGDW